MVSKPPDLPGRCPFSHSSAPCQYGLTCRWAGSHGHDSEVKQNDSTVSPPPPPPELQGRQQQHDGPLEKPLPQGKGDEEWWWRRDDTIPPEVQQIPIATNIQPSLNALDKDVLFSLRKNLYDFSSADSVLETLGYRNNRRERQAKKRKMSTPLSPASDGLIIIRETEREIRAERAKLDFRDKLFLAPLTTLGNLPFRRLAKGLGADITCGEMALATNILQGQPSEWALLKRHPDEDIFGVQVAGGYPDTMAACAQLIEERCQVDFIDINFGCPIDVVCGKNAGASCLRQPSRMEEILRSTSSVLKRCPVTVKMRKGFTDGHDVAHTIVPKLAEWGAAAVVLHGRTREQRYSKLADWPYINLCAQEAAPGGLQVVGNGDVYSWQDHYKRLEESRQGSDLTASSNKIGLATTYIARGALIKPWLFTEIKERRDWDISAGERLEIYKKFCAMGLEHWGSDSRGVESTRKFLLEWLSFTHRYIPIGLLEVLPAALHWRAPPFVGRSDLETLLGSPMPQDWIRITELILGPTPAGFSFQPKHKANAHVYQRGSMTAQDDSVENG